jgi:hypothetical protein
MATLSRTGVAVIACVLTGVFLCCSPHAGAEQGQAGQKTAEQLLLEIMDLHAQLVTNDVFLAQAKMLGAYLESAQPMDEAKKADIYTKVLDMLLKIKDAGVQAPASPAQEKATPEQKRVVQEQEDKSIYVPGAALLEIFKADSIETIPSLPVIRAYWRRDLAYTGNFLLPDRFSEVGQGSRYVARFSFYLEAKEAGDYGFTVTHNEQQNACKVTIGGVDIVKSSREPSGQGVCTLKPGFHRVEFWLVSAVDSGYRAEDDGASNTGPAFRLRRRNDAAFGVKVLVPNALDAAALTKNMMLLKADEKKAQEQEGKKTAGQSIPYVDY